MKSRTTVTIDYPSKAIAEAILESISPDNLDAPNGIIIDAKISESSLKVRIICEEIGELIATADDLLSCIQAAEEALSEVSRNTGMTKI